MLDTTKMTEERKLQKAKITLLRNPKVALLSGILMVGKTYICDKTPTAKTNGRDEWYGRGFVKKLKEKELAFLVMHEAGHKMYRHLTTWRKLHDENHALANMACDYVINLMLKNLDPTEAFMAMPKDSSGKLMGLIDERFKGMNAKQVFDILKQEQKQGPEGKPCEGSGTGQSGQSQADQSIDDHDWDGAKDMTEEQKKEFDREIDQAIRQGIINDRKLNGAGAGDLARELGEMLQPKVDWRDALREFVKSVCAGKDNSTWRRPNRRFLGEGTYMPTLISESVGRVLIAVDTSGSIGGEELNAFLSEVVALCEQVSPEMVDLLYWDSAVARHETYAREDTPNIVSSTKPAGGGGTSPSCITDYIKKKNLDPECAVVLTDGYVGSDWGGAWPCPVLWCIVGGNTAIAPNGKTVHVN
jgi:predicted metal-dependent peptidase